MSFKYEPLDRPDDIRIVVLEPGRPDDDVLCHLKHASLSSDISYEAISYAWGDPKVTQDILIEGQSFAITANLHDKQRVLWADATCINQSNDKEKTQQVQRMGDIYEHAEQVLIWLGDETEETSRAFDSIELLLSLFPPPEVWLTEESNGMAWKFNQVDLDIAGEIPWFARKWIIQEAARSKRAVVLCGGNSIEWAKFTTLCELVCWDMTIMGLTTALLDGICGQKGCQAFTNIGSMGISLQDMDIQEAIWFTRGSDCTDPRDHIMAMIPINAAMQKSQRELDLNYGLETEEIYLRVARWMLVVNSSLQVWELCSNPSNRENASKNLPSWVPDFSHMPISRPIDIDEIGFCAAKNKAVNAKVLVDGRTLSVHGKTICALKTVAKPLMSYQKLIRNDDPNGLSDLESDAILDEKLIAQREWLSQCRLIALECLQVDPFQQESFWKTLTCEFYDFTSEPLNDIITTFGNYWNLLDPSGDYDTVTPEKSWKQGEAEMSLNLPSRHFFVSTDGRLGNAPEGAKSGDLVCLIDGGTVPYALRPRNDGLYTLVGECYLHGVMHGTAPELDDIEEQEYRII